MSGYCQYKDTDDKERMTKNNSDHVIASPFEVFIDSLNALFMPDKKTVLFQQVPVNT